MLLVKCHIKPLFQKVPLVAGNDCCPLFPYSFTNKGIRDWCVVEFKATKGAFIHKGFNWDDIHI